MKDEPAGLSIPTNPSAVSRKIKKRVTSYNFFMTTSPHQTPLLLIDANNVIRPIFEASARNDKEPDPLEHGVRSVWASLYRALQEHKPTHCLLAFDTEETTWRHNLWPSYKENRKPLTEPFKSEMVPLKQQLKAAGFPIVECPGYEAEDLISTLALKAVQRGFDVTVLSTDKDVLTLLSHGIKVHHHFDRKPLDEAYVMNKFGVEPKQMVDYLALRGDATDGVLGVDLVGEKTAAKLLQEYKTLEGVLEAAQGQRIPGKVGQNLAEQSERAKLAKALVQLSTDAPITITPRQLRLPDLMEMKANQALWLLDRQEASRMVPKP